MTSLPSSTWHTGSTFEHHTMRASTVLDVRLDITRVLDPHMALRLAQLLFSGSTGVTIAGSTGVAS